ncbi:MAG: benzoate transporter [Betaproteobacteria bacterium]|jgi:benzoate membrane transport protein|nr:benzoate transporter [Betaproteobacteria bacterium]HAB47241.1 benzoate transporter [Lautropia sp.]NBP34328.1 benzoate transporter [Betaproteobacteria bacterium]NBP37404.1 benzoate transporter [Betaproteobacteria bacterium]NBQ93922.1 benzoate transporter [Betaproteobacteria bacterium]
MPSWRALRRDFHWQAVVNGLLGFIFSASGPLAIILSVGAGAGVPAALIASWVLGCFGINGILSVVLSWVYRKPLAFFWTIPGMVLMGEALKRLPFEEIVGAYLLTAALMLALGLSGLIGRIMKAIPLAIVMAMVAGVFLRFGTDLIRHMQTDAWIAIPMVLVFVSLSVYRQVGRFVPPLIGAVVSGMVLISAFEPPQIAYDQLHWLADPVFTTPVFSLRACLELVVPLSITVLVVQNGQGAAVLRAAGHDAPINTVASACGIWSMLTALVGSVSTCLTGPTNAILVSSGPKDSHYIGGITVGLLAMLFGLFSAGFTGLLMATPGAFIVVLGGLAMLKVLQTAFQSAFKTHFSFGALICFLVTVSGIEIASIGAAFWGLLAGYLASRLYEPTDFKAAKETP